MLLRSLNCTDVDEGFFDELATLGLSQICGVKARNQLELVFTNAEADFEVHRASHLLKSDSYHHVGIEIAYVLRSS